MQSRESVRRRSPIPRRQVKRISDLAPPGFLMPWLMSHRLLNVFVEASLYHHATPAFIYITYQIQCRPAFMSQHSVADKCNFASPSLVTNTLHCHFFDLFLSFLLFSSASMLHFWHKAYDYIPRACHFLYGRIDVFHYLHNFFEAFDVITDATTLECFYFTRVRALRRGPLIMMMARMIPVTAHAIALRAPILLSNFISLCIFEDITF